MNYLPDTSEDYDTPSHWPWLSPTAIANDAAEAEREEFLIGVYDHCRFCGASGDLFYGLCNKCNEESK